MSCCLFEISDLTEVACPHHFFLFKLDHRFAFTFLTTVVVLWRSRRWGEWQFPKFCKTHFENYCTKKRSLLRLAPTSVSELLTSIILIDKTNPEILKLIFWGRSHYVCSGRFCILNQDTNHLFWGIRGKYPRNRTFYTIS